MIFILHDNNLPITFRFSEQIQCHNPLLDAGRVHTVACCVYIMYAATTKIIIILQKQHVVIDNYISSEIYTFPSIEKIIQNNN